MADEVLLVFTTWPDAEKARPPRVLVEEKLAACANLTPAVESTYRLHAKGVGTTLLCSWSAEE